MEKSDIEVNYGRAVEVARKIIEMQNAKVFPFDIPDLYPDAIVPAHMDAGSLEHALMLFHAINTDSARGSDIVYKTFRDLASKVELASLPSLEIDDLRKLLKEPFKSFGDPDKARDNPIDTLSHNAKKLQREYGGNPLNLFAGNVEETLENIQHGKEGKKFVQYGLGKATLLLKNYVRFGMWPFPETDIPIKIDRHNIRIMIGTEVVVPPKDMTRGRTDQLIKILTKLYSDVTRQEKISAVALNDGIWAIGSYNCMKNDGVYCVLNCKLGCSSRPRLEERASYYFPDQDSRKDVHNLFSHALAVGAGK